MAKTKDDISHAGMYKCCVLLIEVTTSATLAGKKLGLCLVYT